MWFKSAYQRKGFGKALLKFVERKYKKKNVKIMQFISNRKSGAFNFYKKLSYNESKELAFMDKNL